MEKLTVECLRCGSSRTVSRQETDRIDAGECPQCGYLGWAPSSALSGPTRRELREQPPERRVRVRPR